MWTLNISINPIEFNFDTLEFESFTFILKIGLFRGGSLSRFEVKRVEIGRSLDRLTRQTNAKNKQKFFYKNLQYMLVCGMNMCCGYEIAYQQ